MRLLTDRSAATGLHGAVRLALSLSVLAVASLSIPPFPPSAAGMSAAPSTSQAVGVSLRRIAGGFAKPLYVTHAGDARLFIVEQPGRIKVLSNGVIRTTPFFDISRRISCCGEQGLLGLAFHPDYARAGTWGYGRLYVNYTDPAGDTVVSEFRRMSSDPNRASGTERVLLKIDQPYSNHNGGHLVFGPDRYLYIATGDGGGAGDPLESAQRTDRLLGKLLRIDPRPSSTRPYSIPSTNPYVGRVGLDHIWALGLRNPWRFSFDRATGNLWIGDVGQSSYEEVDRSLASPTTKTNAGRAANYGWDMWEGNSCYEAPCSSSGMTFPLAVYGQANTDNCSVTGGYVYRGSQTLLQGRYVFGDFCSGRIWLITATASQPATPALAADTPRFISSFGEGVTGGLYLTDLNSGELYQVHAYQA